MDGIELGTIEGFYGRPWSWSERGETVRFLASHGYGFYLYAPKADTHLRRRWQEDHPPETADRLRELAGQCQDAGVRFGIGLSPYEAWLDFGPGTRAALARKLAFFDEVRIQDLALLFDDMRGDDPALAQRQVEMVEWAAGRTGAERVIVCPTYYSDDPVLDRVFGARPESYLEDLGRALDPAIHLFWTGEEVVSREVSPAHMERVASEMRRRPFLWDNYPVNDGQRMSQYLHLRAFTGRPSTLQDCVAAHGINPALQPTLSRIPALTLAENYRQGTGYAYGAAFRRAATKVAGPGLARLLWEDILVLQDIGLDRLGDREASLRERYGAVDHAAAREVIAWLDGAYRITDEIVRTQ
jgi:hyaluronoglucosaminidase